MTDVDIRGLPADIAERRALGHDRRDEVWEGEYRMVPPGPHSRHGRVDRSLGRLIDPYADRAGLVALSRCNVGERLDYRVPDGALVRGEPDGVNLRTAEVLLEVLSDDDDTFAKFGFYAAHGVREVIVADPVGRTVRCWHLVQGAEVAGELVERDRSDVLGVGMAGLTAALPWP